MPEIVDFIESQNPIIPHLRLSRNVYINEKLVVKVLEFGYARYVEKGTIDYTATHEDGRVQFEQGSIHHMVNLFLKDDE
jgi:hypothetical protein